MNRENEQKFDFAREEAAVYLLERAEEEAYEEKMAHNQVRAHIDNGEEQCDECGGWVDDDDLVPYQGQDLCPACRRGYILDDFEKLADEIQISFSGPAWGKALALLDHMKKEAEA
jgi:formylmethanofuran dehydrogenase subunit E